MRLLRPSCHYVCRDDPWQLPLTWWLDFIKSVYRVLYPMTWRGTVLSWPPEVPASFIQFNCFVVATVSFQTLNSEVVRPCSLAFH